MVVLLTLKVTLTIEPALAVAVALTVTADPETVAPDAGAVIATVGLAALLTVTLMEVVEVRAPLSNAVAEIE